MNTVFNRRTVLMAAALGASTSLLQACGGGDDEPQRNIVELAQNTPELSILVEAVVAAGLAPTLSTGTLTVFAPSRFTAGHTCGSIAGQALELFTCAPSTRYGAPSTSNALRPLRVTSSGMGASAPATIDAHMTPANNQARHFIDSPPPSAKPSSAMRDSIGSAAPMLRLLPEGY